MAKLTKQQRKMHDEAMDRLRGSPLSLEDREFVYRHLQPGATTDIGRGSAFFTPWDIAGEFQLETLNKRPKKVLDLCAGYGILSMLNYCYDREPGAIEVTCLEINPDYVEIGQRLFPEAEWIRGDVFDAAEILAGRHFDEFFSNPPFGNVPNVNGKRRHAASRFEYAVAEIGMSLADTGTMIVLQGVPDWKYSGREGYCQIPNDKYAKWVASSGLRLAPNCGIDCSFEAFEHTSVTVDIALVERVESDEYEPEPAAMAPVGHLF